MKPTVEELRGQLARWRERLKTANGEAYTEIEGNIRGLEVMIRALTRKEGV